MATHARILALGSSMDRGAWGATVQGGHKRVRHNLVTKQQIFSLSLHTDIAMRIKTIIILYSSCF